MRRSATAFDPALRPAWPADPMLWAFLGLVWCIVQILLPLQQITVTGMGFLGDIVLALLAAACLAHSISRRDRSIAVLLESMAALFCVILVFGPYSYVVTRSPLPAIDPWLRSADQALGLDASAWRQAVIGSFGLRWFHVVAYGSLAPQTCLALIVLSRKADGRRALQFLRASVLALTLTGAIAYCFPAEGTLPEVESWAADWQALHASGWPFSMSAGHIEGIISFPSFHAVMSVILGWSMRGLGALSWAFAALDACMLVCTPAMGCHYLCDLPAGIAVAACCILVVLGLDLEHAAFWSAEDRLADAVPQAPCWGQGPRTPIP